MFIKVALVIDDSPEFCAIHVIPVFDIHINTFYQVCNIYIYPQVYKYKRIDIIFDKIRVISIGFSSTYVKYI